MAKIDRLSPGPVRTEEDKRRALEQIIQKINEVIAALNTLLP